MTEFTAMLRGVNFRPEEVRRIAKTLVEQQPLTLLREPGNPHDANAIQVIEPDSQMFIGYVAKEIAVELAPVLDSDVEYTCVCEANMAGSILLMINTTDADAEETESL